MPVILQRALDTLGLSSQSNVPWTQDPFFVNMANPSISSHHRGPSADTAHPSMARLTVLVLSAVFEVICVSLPGYLLARRNMFNQRHQEFVASLNIALFTPCLIFSKIASQFTPDKLVSLFIIPVIFVLQTLVSYFVANGVSRLFKLKTRPQSFLTAMAVFGNSNSLPISLTISLSKTLPSLRWDKIANDNSEEVAARGILYLMIFQQLGQILRWTWGYKKLLRPAREFTIDEGGCGLVDPEDGKTYHPTDCPHPRHLRNRRPRRQRHLLVPDDTGLYPRVSVDLIDVHEGDRLLGDHDPDATLHPSSVSSTQDLLTPPKDQSISASHNSSFVTLGELYPHGLTSRNKSGSPNVFCKSCKKRFSESDTENDDDDESSETESEAEEQQESKNDKNPFLWSNPLTWPSPLISVMNPPLWAMLAAIVVAWFPPLRLAFFTKGTFVNTSVTRAIEQSGQVAVPLILVVLGANLANKTSKEQKENDPDFTDEPGAERRLIILSLVCRMFLPALIMALPLALAAKYVPISILDDPIFVVVAFLLSGAPSALQLAQMCQEKKVYTSAMTSILFQSYVIWILPSTLILVMVAVEVVKWAAAS